MHEEIESSSLSNQVLAEVDRLERGRKELSREESLCINSSPRDTKRVEDIEKNSSKITQEILGGRQGGDS